MATLAIILAAIAGPDTHERSRGGARPLLVVGSVNADIIIEVDRLPASGETVCTRRSDTGRVVPGGKGCNQAICAARVGQRVTRFIGQFGGDTHAPMLEAALSSSGVDVSACCRRPDLPSGQGYVFLDGTGSVSSIVVGGANADWPVLDASTAASLVRGCAAVLLQREIPEHVNEAIAEAANVEGIPVLQDMGGEDRPISDAQLRRCAVVSPNKSELRRLTGMPLDTKADVLTAAESLRARGARSVLVTLGSEGSVLLADDGTVYAQPCVPVPGGTVVDETGAGDCYRVAFAVALVEGRPLHECMRFAAAAGALAVSRMGAVPSVPAREEVEVLSKASAKEALSKASAKAEEAKAPPPLLREQRGGGDAGDRPSADGGGGGGGGGARGSGEGGGFVAEPTADGPHCPLEFASRLNSMKDRPDLWDGDQSVLGWVARQGQVRGLGLVDFNYPQHLDGLDVARVCAALETAGLRAGAVCLRYPKRMQLGAMTHPDPGVRREAIELTKQAGDWAKALGAKEIVIWSAFDGYDYSLQVNHLALWQRIVDAFREVCDAHPDLKVSLEFKPTDENTRFFAVPSTGAAMMLMRDIDRPNMGLTLDVGHCLAAGENPGQSVAMVGAAGKLFGIQLNDGYTRLGAEDGLMFASVHPLMALEVVYWLQETGFDGHIYYDTFPRNEDPVREAEYNIRRFKALWAKAQVLRAQGMGDILKSHDALATLELLERIGQ